MTGTSTIALINDPRLLIADEPTSALDSAMRDQVLSLIEKLVAERNMGLLLNKPRPAAGRPALRTGHGHVSRRTARPITGRRTGERNASLYAHAVVVPPLQGDPRSTFAGIGPRRVERNEMSEPIIRLQQLSVAHQQGYSRRTVVQGINLTVAAGECFGLVGPSGCGKSSLLWVLAGLNPHWQGQMRLLGRDLAPGRPFTGVLRREVQMVFLDPYSYPCIRSIN